MSSTSTSSKATHSTFSSRPSSSKSHVARLFSLSPRDAPPSTSSPPLLERKTTTWLKTPDLTPKKPATRIDQFDELVRMNNLDTVVRPAQNDVFHAPAFKLMPYGKAWYLDIVVFFTNAIRYETKSLFFILYCLHERNSSLEEGDVESFFVWFESYHNFFTTIVSVLQASFLSWIESAADLPANTPRSFFVSLGSDLSRTVRKTLQHKQHFLSKYQPQEASLKLRKLYTGFAVKLLDYLSKLDESCSTLIEANYSVSECRKISRALVNEMSTMPNYKKNLVLLLRWLESRPETSAAWRRAHLDPRSGLCYPRWRRPGSQEECMAYFLRKCEAIPEPSLRF